MKLFIFIISYILLSLLGSLSYIGILLLAFTIMKKAFNMNENKWNTLFRYRNGKGLYFLMVLPYLITLVIILPISIFWFELINFDYRILGSISIVILLTLTGIFKFSKLKGMVQNKFQENYWFTRSEILELIALPGTLVQYSLSEIINLFLKPNLNLLDKNPFWSIFCY